MMLNDIKRDREDLAALRKKENPTAADKKQMKGLRDAIKGVRLQLKALNKSEREQKRAAIDPNSQHGMILNDIKRDKEDLRTLRKKSDLTDADKKQLKGLRDDIKANRMQLKALGDTDEPRHGRRHERHEHKLSTLEHHTPKLTTREHKTSKLTTHEHRMHKLTTLEHNTPKLTTHEHRMHRLERHQHAKLDHFKQMNHEHKFNRMKAHLGGSKFNKPSLSSNRLNKLNKLNKLNSHHNLSSSSLRH